MFITKQAPLFLFSVYIVFTLLLSFFGPKVYEGYQKDLVFLYMFFFLILFFSGYQFGLHKTLNNIRPRNLQRVDERRILVIVKICILLSLCVVVAQFVQNTLIGETNLDVSKLGKQYIQVYKGYVHNSGRGYTLLEIVSFLSGFPRWVAMILGIYYFKKLNYPYKLSLISFLVLMVIVYTFGRGQQKYVGDIVIFISAVTLIKMVNLSPEARRKLLCVIIIILISSAILFTAILKQRYEALGINIFNYSYKGDAYSDLNIEHPIFKIFGPEWGFPLSKLLSGYLSDGYYGLSLCMQLPFIWTYGVGNSYTLMVLINRFLGLPFLLSSTYVLRMEATTGHPSLSLWHTVFPWFASDFTFIGTLFVFMGIAYVYATSWIEAYKYRNPLSILMFCVLSLGLIYVPGNNQLLHGVEGFFATCFLGFIWSVFHKRYNFTNHEITIKV